MKKTNCYILLLLMAAALTACSSDVDQGQQSPFTDLSPDGAVPVTFSVSDLRDITRAASSIVTFNANEKVKVFVKPNGASDYTQYDYKTAAGQSNVSLTLEKNYATNDATPPYFPAGTGTTVQAYAYYPATAASAATFSVAGDQTSDANYKASDLMYAEVRTITKGSSEGTNLQMSHLMAQLHLNVTGVGLTVNRVLVNAKKSVTFTPSDGTATATGTASDIVAATAAGDAYVCIPVQPINTVTIKVETGSAGDNATTANFTFTSTSDFAAGKSYPINLTVNATSLGTTTAISDWNGQQSVTYAPTGDLTIDPISEVIYNGSAYTPTLVVKKGSTTLTKDAANGYTCQWFTNTNAGTAVVLVLGQGAYAGSVAVGKFTINKADITPSVSMNGWTYGGTAQNPSVTGNSGNGSVSYQYKVSTAGDDTYTTTTPTNAGTYTVRATVGETTNYNGATATANFTISKADCSVTLDKTSLTLEAGQNGTISVTRPSTGTVSASSSDNSIATVSVSGTTVTVNMVSSGEATITIKVSADSNYNESEDKTVSVSSNPLAQATSADVGKIIGADGKIYATKAAAESANTTAVAMIVYVGAAGTADASSSTYKGLAIALTDASTGSAWYGTSSSYSSTCVYQNSTFSNHYGYADMKGIANTNQMANKTGNCSSHTTHAAATAAKNYSSTVAVPANCSQWFLPTSGQWLRFFRNSTLNLTWSDWGWAAGTGSDNFNKVNKMFTDAGASSAVFSSGPYYWSSSEYSASNAVTVYFLSSNGVFVSHYNKSYTRRVRAFLAF